MIIIDLLCEIYLFKYSLQLIDVMTIINVIDMNMTNLQICILTISDKMYYYILSLLIQPKN